jgi:hypothetical protein
VFTFLKLRQTKYDNSLIYGYSCELVILWEGAVYKDWWYDSIPSYRPGKGWWYDTVTPYRPCSRHWRHLFCINRLSSEFCSSSDEFMTSRRLCCPPITYSCQELVGIEAGYDLTGRPGFNCPQCKNFLFTMAPWPALGPRQLPTQWLPGALSPEFIGRGVKMTTHLHLVSGVTNGGAIPPLPLCLHGVTPN